MGRCSILGKPLLALAFSAGLSAQSVDFLRDIRPLLSDNCFACHGPDAAARMANFRLDRQEDAFAQSVNGTVIVPGDPQASLLYQRISADDPARRMPPAYSGKELTSEQIGLIRRWIDAGASWNEPWILTAPQSPAPPRVANSAWVRNPIDTFILSRLEAEGLQPASEADRRTLIRRLALDLTGLPPTPEEVESFVNDPGPQAYEKRVDAYMAKPAWGEHRGRYWLDAARYADTHGLHMDNYLEVWPYREWVISAFNRNIGFDQFTIEQLAGDLLPNPTRDQLIATGFHRANVTTNEAGVIEEEVAAIYAKDRVDTTSAVWLGLTVGCASCHDHKFDPITQKDFYSLSAFFRNTTQQPLDGNVYDTNPTLAVRSAQDEARWNQLQQDEQAARAELTSLEATAQAGFNTWLAQSRQTRTDPFNEAGAFFARFEAEPVREGRRSVWVATEGIQPADAPAVTADNPFTLGVSFFLPLEKYGGPLLSRSDPDDEGRGWVLFNDNQRPRFVIVGDHGEQLGVLGDKTAYINRGQWNHVGVVYNGSRTREGIRLFVNGVPVAGETWGNGLHRAQGALDNEAPLLIGAEDDSSTEGLGVSHLQILNRAASEQEVRLLASWPVMENAGGKSGADLTSEERSALLLDYLLRESSDYRARTERLAAILGAQSDIRRRSSVTPVMSENPDAAPFAHVLIRGMYDQPGERVEAATPSALPPMAASLPRNRLGLARWLVDEANPLTSRVTVNRFWQEIFGIGIVETSEDFGSQGQPPSHPELLDWLAVELRESGWDVKALFRLIVTSSAYRQSAAVTPEKLQQDPRNLLLSRGPRFRMDAEMVRDAALAASGLLVERVGGPSVKPNQPAGVWEAVAMPDSNTRFYAPDSGDALHRRSVYTFWKRAAPPPALQIFNAPTREQCTVRRERTNTPLQALVTMNASDFIEAARALAENAAASAAELDTRLDFMTMRVLARTLEPRERTIFNDAYRDYLSYYATAPADTAALGASNAEAAALTMLANQLLNLDEALNK